MEQEDDRWKNLNRAHSAEEKTCQFTLRVQMIESMRCVAILAMREVEENRVREKRSKSGTGG